MASLITREELAKRIEAQVKILALMTKRQRVCEKCLTLYEHDHVCFCDYESDQL